MAGQRTADTAQDGDGVQAPLNTTGLADCLPLQHRGGIDARQCRPVEGLKRE